MKVLIEKTASSLDDTALLMLFVSVQQNNIELCITYALIRYIMFSLLRCFDVDPFSFIHVGFISTVCLRHCNPNDCKAEFDSGGFDMAYNALVWAFICE